MRTLPTASLAAALLTAASGTADAGHSRPHQGTVQSVDPAADTVTLDDGTKFHAASGVETDGLEPGTDVIFYYHVYDGQNTVVSYDILDAADLETQPAAGQQ